MSEIENYVDEIYNHNEKLRADNPNIHKDFLKLYKKLSDNKTVQKGDCTIGNYCGVGGCYRESICSFKNDYPKSKEIAIKLGKYRKNKFDEN